MSVADGAKVNIGKNISVRGQASGQNIPAGQLVSMTYDVVNASHKVIASAQSTHIGFKGTTANDPRAHNFILSKTGAYRIRLTVKIGPGGQVAPGSAAGNCLSAVSVQKPCQEFVSVEDIEVCFRMRKEARNITQNIEHANNTKARPGDVIEYTLSIKNTAKIRAKATFVEDMNDVLQYADVTNLHGGTISTRKIVSWPAQFIAAGATATHLITVRVKNPLPNTPSPCPLNKVVSRCPNSGSFDLTMTNVFGNAINIKLPKSVPKTTEIITTESLPNTGPGSSIVMVFGLTTVAGYFFARSRLLAKELDIIRKEYNVSGGM